MAECTPVLRDVLIVLLCILTAVMLLCLIRAVRGQAAADPAAYEALRDFLHTPLILDRLLGEEKKA